VRHPGDRAATRGLPRSSSRDAQSPDHAQPKRAQRPVHIAARPPAAPASTHMLEHGLPRFSPFSPPHEWSDIAGAMLFTNVVCRYKYARPFTTPPCSQPPSPPPPPCRRHAHPSRGTSTSHAGAAADALPPPARRSSPPPRAAFCISAFSQASGGFNAAAISV